ncbi:TPA: YopX family protein [Streptococcus suis]
MIPKFRVWDTIKKAMSEVEAIVYTEEKVYPFYSKVIRRYIPFSEAILMQSTGLFDKNGKEIFEGDIVVNKYGNVGYVAYLQQEAGFVVVLKKSDYRLGHRNTGESYDVTTNHEIIGNIYQNPELVEE